MLVRTTKGPSDEILDSRRNDQSITDERRTDLIWIELSFASEAECVGIESKEPGKDVDRTATDLWL